MGEFGLVLNAGSSSLKFSVHRRHGGRWGLEARGQIEGIGTAPKMSVKDGEGKALAAPPPGTDMRDAGSRVEAWVVPTNEELMIARHTAQVLGLQG